MRGRMKMKMTAMEMVAVMEGAAVMEGVAVMMRVLSPPMMVVTVRMW